MRTAIVTPLAALAAGLLSLPGQAQVKPITDNGAAEGLSPDVVNFEPEYRDRSARDAGIAVPAPPGTIPSPPDPHDLNGIWIAGKVYPIGRKGGPDLGAGPHAPVDPGIRTAGVYGVGHRHIPQALCLPHSPFAMGLPSKIIETPKVIYILRNGQDGTGYRRIVMNGAHPKDLQPTYAGDSVGHWEGDTLVVETVGLKGQMTTGSFSAPIDADYTPNTKVTERIKKIEGNLKLEDTISFEDPSALKEPYRARIVSYWRPDLKLVEAPCEEYSDPLEYADPSSGPFQGGDEPQRLPGAPPAAPASGPPAPAP